VLTLESAETLHNETSDDVSVVPVSDSIGGLANKQAFYVIVVDANKFRLAETAKAAALSESIRLDNFSGSG